MSIEQRLSRLEVKEPDGGERVWYARSTKDAAAAYNQAIADGRKPLASMSCPTTPHRSCP